MAAGNWVRFVALVASWLATLTVDIAVVREIALASAAAFVVESRHLALSAGVVVFLYLYLKMEPAGENTKMAFIAISVMLIAFPYFLLLWRNLFKPAEPFHLSASAGWQNTNFYIPKATNVHVDVEGRISLALNQEYHLTEFMRHKVVKGPDEIRLSPENAFVRSWIPPTGDPNTGEMVDDLKMVPGQPWGVVICATRLSPGPTIDQVDPWSVGIRSNIVVIPRKSDEYYFSEPGYIVCMINEAVISDKSPQSISRQYYADLSRPASRQLDSRHHFEPEEIPLIFLNNNAGGFNLRLTSE